MRSRNSPIRDVQRAFSATDCDNAGDNSFLPLGRVRLFSVYNEAGGTRFSVITEADHSATSVFLPKDHSTHTRRSATPPAATDWLGVERTCSSNLPP